MGIFEYEQICSLNEKEFGVYNYVFTHQQETLEMNIRELAEITGVSTTTVLRTCRKIGCEGFTELKYQIRKQLQPEGSDGRENRLFRVIPALQYLRHSMEDRDLEEKLGKLAEMCIQSQTVGFLGHGRETGLARYGAYLFAEMGLTAFTADDPHYPISAGGRSGKTVLLVLAVSGETDPLIADMDKVKKNRGYVASITNTDQSVAARLSDLNLPCYMPVSFLNSEGESILVSTQLPSLYLLERLADRVHGLIGR